MEAEREADAGYGSDAIAQAVRTRWASGQGGGGGGAASIPQQIAQLAQLRDQGHITPDEYERKKAQLLDRM